RPPFVNAPQQVRQFPPLLVTRLTICLSTAFASSLPPLLSLDTHNNFTFVSQSFWRSIT
ncbi:hypothetical protein K439DRAFT_1628045, partial [Ramaria rubella]